MSSIRCQLAAVEKTHQDAASVPLDEKPPSDISQSLANRSNTALSYERTVSADQQVP